MKKSQISQAFIYILAIIVFSLVLLFGYKSIKGLISQSEKVDYIHFKTKLESTIKRVDYGDKIIEEFSVPKGYNEVCFINLEEPAETTTNAIIDDSWASEVNANVFLVASNEDVESFYAEKLIAADKDDPENIHFACVPVVQGRIRASFEGMGKYAQASQAP